MDLITSCLMVYLHRGKDLRDKNPESWTSSWLSSGRGVQVSCHQTMSRLFWDCQGKSCFLPCAVCVQYVSCLWTIFTLSGIMCIPSTKCGGQPVLMSFFYDYLVIDWYVSNMQRVTDIPVYPSTAPIYPWLFTNQWGKMETPSRTSQTLPIWTHIVSAIFMHLSGL